MKTKNIFIILIILAALAAIKIFFFFANVPSSSSSSSKNRKEQVITISVYTASLEKLDNKLFATGSIIANEEVELRPEASGKIVRLLFKEGSTVSKGELLVKINDADLQATLAKLEIELKLAGEKEERQEKLLKVGGTSQEEYDAVLNNFNTLKADIAIVKAQIQKTEIYAPFSGTIGLKSVSEGSYVSPTVKIASIQQTDPVKIDFSVPEKYSSLLHKGDSIHFSLTGSTEIFRGEIYAIEPKIDMSTRTLQLRALCENKKGTIFPGSFAKIEIVLKSSGSSILIPTEALIPELKGQKVFICRNGRAVSQKVETGLRTDSQIEIISGLQQGDSVITGGIMQLKPDMKVKVGR